MHHQVCPCSQGARRKLVIHACSEVTSVGFIHQHRTAQAVKLLNQGRWILGISLVSGMHQKRCSDSRALGW